MERVNSSDFRWNLNWPTFYSRVVTMSKKRAITEEEEAEDNKSIDGGDDGGVTIDASHVTREVLTEVPLADGQTYLKIMSWNVNGLRALVAKQKSVLIALVEKHKPDILCFQETKIQDNAIDEYDGLLDGYESYWNCSTVKKGYSGTAVFLKKATISLNTSVVRSGSVPSSSAPPKKQAKLSAFFKKGISEPVVSEAEKPVDATPTAPISATTTITTMEKVSFDFEDETKRFHGEGRTITVEFTDFILVACYVPNSGEGLVRLKYRVEEWEPHMRQYLKNLAARKPVVFTGDLNCGFEDLDIHNPTAKHISKQSGLTPLERAAFAEMLSETRYRDAFRHFHPTAKGQFTYWSVRAFNRPGNKGIRLDYFICSRDLFPPTAEDAESEAKTSPVLAHDSYILHKDTVGCSDHCPVVLVVKIN